VALIGLQRGVQEELDTAAGDAEGGSSPDPAGVPS
jgi:hypothetical protein